MKLLFIVFGIFLVTAPVGAQSPDPNKLTRWQKNLLYCQMADGALTKPSKKWSETEMNVVMYCTGLIEGWVDGFLYGENARFIIEGVRKHKGFEIKDRGSICIASRGGNLRKMIKTYLRRAETHPDDVKLGPLILFNAFYSRWPCKK
jgi:hypothetical protein